MADGPIVDPLFIAVPELVNDIDYLRRLRELGYISGSRFEQLVSLRAQFKRANRLAGDMDGKTVLQRVMMVAPELFTVSTVNFMSVTGLLDKTAAAEIRLAIRSIDVIRGGRNQTIAKRVLRLLEINVSEERIDIWRQMDLIDVETANRFRGYLALGKGGLTAAERTRRGKDLFDRLWMLTDGIAEGGVLRGMVLTGMLDPKQVSVYQALVKLTKRGWTAFDGARAVDGYKDRLLLTLAGLMHDDTIDALVKSGVVSKKYRPQMQLMAQIGRRVNDRMFERVMDRRYRILPGETPIKTFARATRRHDDDILRLLASAARDAGKTARGLEELGGRGNAARAAQLRITRAQLHTQMRLLWEGQGYMTIVGEKQAAEAAAESLDELVGKYLGRNLGEAARRTLLWQSKAGVDSYISRAENRADLSRRVYRNMAFFDGRLDRKIDMLLLQGKSANEFAKEIEGFINPRVAGGVRYSAMRLARTEINNAFHLTTIRYTREMPWVKGMKWHLSGSHGRPDVCNEMASNDHAGLGPGVYRKNNVPGKPHPHCLCFVTAVLMTDSEFSAAQRAGRFQRYLNGFGRGETVEPENGSLWRAVGSQAVFGLNVLVNRRGVAIPEEVDGRYRFSTPEPFFKTRLPTPPPGLYD